MDTTLATFLISFADRRNWTALNRLAKQATAMNVFERIYECSVEDLDLTFRRQFSSILNIRTRGYGYWIWKPQILLQIAARHSVGDVLLYLDAGCHLNSAGRERLVEYIEIAAQGADGLVPFQLRAPDLPFPHDGRPLDEHLDAHWTKADVFARLGCLNQKDLTHTPMVEAGVLLFRVGSRGHALIREWGDILREDMHFFNDSPSSIPNLEGFIEHRHDQSIYSLLVKQYAIPTLSAFEYWYPSKENTKTPDWQKLNQFPIHAMRDIPINTNFYFKVLRKTRRLWQAARASLTAMKQI